jgi:hypothetical protein
MKESEILKIEESESEVLCTDSTALVTIFDIFATVNVHDVHKENA